MASLRPLFLSALVALAACQQKPAAVPDTVTPDASVRAAVAGLKTGDLKTLVNSQVPPAELERLRAEWKVERASKPITDADRKQFAETMASLTAPNAETELYKKLDPQLQKMEGELAVQLPGWIDLGRNILDATIKANKDLNEAQKQEAMKSVDAIAHWAESVKFTDREQAKRTIAVVCRTARELNLKTLDETRALEFDQAVDKFAIVFRGLKEILSNYGLSVDRVLDTVKTQTVAQTGDSAKVAVSYQLLDAPIRYETELTRIDGHWYGKEMLDRLHKPRLAVSGAPEGAAPEATEPPPDGHQG
jgi:hypothetical protein